MSNSDTRLSLIRRRLESDPLAVDLLWSIMIAAMSHYRHDTVLRPFPPMYLKRETGADSSMETQVQTSSGNAVTDINKDIAALSTDAQLMPSMAMLSKSPPTGRLLDLLHWTLDTKNFLLRTCNISVFTEIEALTGQSVPVPRPDYVFELVYTEEAEQRFLALKGDRALLYGYHGSRTENFHSIMHFGLSGHMSKNAVFGEGTYLSSELSVSLHYSPTGKGWERSSLGAQLSCVAVCEIIDDPSVKCKIHAEAPGGGTGGAGAGGGRPDSRLRVEGSLGGDVPEKYYVVRNDKVLRVKYILVYARKHKQDFSQSFDWIRQYIIALVLALYAVLLVCLGVYKSDAWRMLMRRFYRADS